MKQSLERVLTEPCPYCTGTGTIKSSSTICYEILSEVKKIGADLNGGGVVLRVNPEIARALKEEERAVMADLKQALGKDVIDPAGYAPAPRAVRSDVAERSVQPGELDRLAGVQKDTKIDCDGARIRSRTIFNLQHSSNPPTFQSSNSEASLVA